MKQESILSLARRRLQVQEERNRMPITLEILESVTVVQDPEEDCQSLKFKSNYVVLVPGALDLDAVGPDSFIFKDGKLMWVVDHVEKNANLIIVREIVHGQFTIANPKKPEVTGLTVDCSPIITSGSGQRSS